MRAVHDQISVKHLYGYVGCIVGKRGDEGFRGEEGREDQQTLQQISGIGTSGLKVVHGNTWAEGYGEGGVERGRVVRRRTP